MSVCRLLFLTVLVSLLALLPASASAPLELNLAGQLAYGLPRDVAIDGSYAYVASQGALSVFDISNPARPTQVAVVDTPGSAEGVAVSGGYLYVADWDGGLRVVDISTPAQPVEVGHYDTPGYAYGVAVSDGYAYVADHAAGLRILDISNPESPTEAGDYDTAGYAWNVAVAGGYAFVADGFGGLVILNVSDPGSPALEAVYLAGDRVMDVAVSGDYAYLADGTNGLQVVDISTPDAPAMVGMLDDLDGRALGIFLDGSKVYLAADTAGLHVVDVTTPATPQLLASYNTAGRAYAVAVADDAAFVADDLGGLRVIQVSAEPVATVVGQQDTPGNAEAVAVQVRDSVPYAFVADGGGGLRTFNVSDPTAPTSSWYCSGMQAMDVAVSGDYAFVADWGFGLRIVDIADPSGPACDAAGLSLTDHPIGLGLADDRAYVAVGGAGVTAVNIADPLAPSELWTIDTPGSANDVVASGDSAFVADGPAGLQILQVVSPTDPALIGSAATGGYAWGVDYSDGYAYVASGNAGLVVVDVANPASPTVAASLALAGAAHSVFYKDGYAFVSVGGRGVVVVDVRNLAALAVVASCGTPSTPGPSSLEVFGGYAYVADAEAGLVVVDILAPYVELAARQSPAHGRRLALRKLTAGSAVGYVASGPSGLHVVQAADATDVGNPTLVRTSRALGNLTDVAIEAPGAYAYASNDAGRLSILSLSNPTNPYLVGSIQTSGSGLGVAATTVSGGTYALVAGGYPGLSVVSTTSKTAPVESMVVDTPGWSADVMAATLAGEPFALVADGHAGLRLLNLSPVRTPPVVVFSEGFESSDPLAEWDQIPTVELYSGSPRRGTRSVRLRQEGAISRGIPTVGFTGLTLSWFWGVSGLDTSADYLAVEWSANAGGSWTELARLGYGDLDADGALHYQTSELPEAAEDNASFALRFRLYGDDAGDYAYLDDIQLTSDTSSQPVEVGFYNTPGQASGVALARVDDSDYALVADGERGLRIVDVSAPGSPIEVSSFDTGGYAEAVSVFGTVAAVATGGGGVSLVDFRDPAAPEQIAYFNTPGWASDIQVLEGHAWVADTGWGLMVFQLWNTFRDILFGNWAFFEIEEATRPDNKISNRVVIGYDDGLYRPEVICSRDQMAVFIARSMGWLAYDEPMNDAPALFDDIPAGFWAGRAIQLCVENEIVQGYTDNYYRPTLSVTRDQMAVFIARARGWVAIGDQMDAAADDIFLDVPRNYWCATAIEACVDNGIVRGYPDGYYRPWLPVTRDQMAVFVYRAFLQ